MLNLEINFIFQNWLKNNEFIDNSSKTVIEFRNGVCRLTIPHATQGMEFSFCLSVKNDKFNNLFLFNI